MRQSRFLATRNMSAADVLESLRETHRHFSVLDPEVDGEVVLSFETTVAQWQEADDLVEWRALGRALNKEYEVDFGDAQWREVLKPERRKTLRDICELIAQRAQCPAAKPLRVCGTSCLSAGVFLTLRSSLRKSGVSVEDLRPTSKLSFYLENHAAELTSIIGKMAPARVPLIEVEYSKWQDAGCFALIGSFVASLVSLATPWPQLQWTMATIFFLSFIALFVSFRAKPASVELGNLHTFRDLVGAMIGAPVES